MSSLQAPSMLDHLLPWRLRALVWQFARKDIVLRYRGSWLGLGWSVVTPLAMLGIYTLVFKHVFNTRWPAAKAEGMLDFALNLYAGLIVFNWAAEMLNRAPRLVLEQPNLVTKVVFPLPLLTWSALLSTGFHALVGMLIWLAACLAYGYGPTLAWLALPVVALVMVPWLLALGWFLSGVGVYLRDVSLLVGLLVSGLMFLTPIFYPVEALPDWLRPVAFFNPLTAPIEALRALVLSAHLIVPWEALSISAGMGTLLCVLSLWIYRRLQTGFADVL